MACGWPTGSPSAFKTQFGWVLAGTAGGCRHNRKSTGSNCYLATTFEDTQGSDELMRTFWEIENPSRGAFQTETLSRRRGKVRSTSTFEKGCNTPR